MSEILLQAWQKTLRARADDPAIVQAVDGAAATFSELDARADIWVGRHAQRLNTLRGRAVLYAAPNGIGWFEVFLGLIKSGAVVVPVDATEPPLSQRRLAVAIRAGFWWDGTQLEPLSDSKRYRDPEISLIKLTSGTTGNPRTLVFTAAQLLADARQVTTTMRIGPRDVNYALIPLGHSYGLGNLAVPLVAQGISLICGSAPLPDAIATDFARWKPTVFPGVPTLWRALAASDVSLPGLRLAISAGAPLAPQVARDFARRFGQRLHSFYGSSETGGIAYDRRGDATLAGGVGRALHGVTLTIGKSARLLVSSAAVLTHNNRRRIAGHGAWIMPDRVTLDARGDLTLLGRRSTTVKISGRRVNLAEVSDRLRTLAGVREAWVGVSEGNDPVLGAIVATERTAAELRAALQVDTAVYKIPKKLVIVAALPTTARGKFDSRALQAMLFPASAGGHIKK